MPAGIWKISSNGKSLRTLGESLKAQNNAIFAQLSARWLYVFVFSIFVATYCCFCFQSRTILSFFARHRALSVWFLLLIHVINMLKVSFNLVWKQFNSQWKAVYKWNHTMLFWKVIKMEETQSFFKREKQEQQLGIASCIDDTNVWGRGPGPSRKNERLTNIKRRNWAKVRGFLREWKTKLVIRSTQSLCGPTISKMRCWISNW